MSAPHPIRFTWDGESFTPATEREAREADKHFVVGEVYPLEVREDRSVASHNHYFAQIAEAWQNLPEHMAALLPSPDHLRRYALIQTGFCDQRSIVCATNAEAERMVAFIAPMDTFAVVFARAETVLVYTAKSQSYRAMGKDEFKRSKNAALEFVARLIGTKPADLERNTRDAA